MLTGNS